MEYKNKILTDEFFFRLEALIESNYTLDIFDNIVLKIPKNDLRKLCNDMISEYASEIEESEEDIKKHILAIIDRLSDDETIKNDTFKDEHRLVKELLEERENQTIKQTNTKNNDIER